MHEDIGYRFTSDFICMVPFILQMGMLSTAGSPVGLGELQKMIRMGAGRAFVELNYL